MDTDGPLSANRCARRARLGYCLTVVSLASLILLGLAWELWLAPLRPSGSWWVLKIIPLLFPLFGVLNGRRYAFKVLSLLIWFYALEGSLRVTVESGLAQALAAAELTLSLLAFAGLALFLRTTRPH